MILCLICACLLAARGQTLAEWELRDSLGHQWTGELLYYNIPLKQPVAPSQPLALFDETGQAVPVQVVERRANSLRVALITDLNPFQQKHFRLVAAQPEHAAADLYAKKEGAVWALGNARLGVTIPAGQGKAAAFAQAPAPIVSIRGAGQGWLTGTRPVAWKSEILATGPVFAWARVSYDFGGGQSYTVDLRVPAGQPVVLVREERKLPDATAYETADAFHLALASELSPTHVYSKRGLGSRGYFVEKGPEFAGTYLTPAQLHFIPTACNIVGTWREGATNARFIGLFPRFLSHWTRPHDTAIPLVWDQAKGLTARFYLNDGVREWGLMAGPRDAMITPRGTGGEGQLAGYFDALLLNNKWGETPLDKVKDWALDWGVPHPTSEISHLKSEVSDKTVLAKTPPPRGSMPYFAEQFLLGGQKWEDTYIHVHQTWTGEGDAWERYRQTIPTLPPEQLLSYRAAAAFVMYKQTDPDYWPAANWIGPSNPNMKIMGWAAIALGALTLDKHPKAQEWLGLGLQNLRRHLDESASADGAWLECPGYDGAGIAPLVSVALALRKKGRDDLIADGRLLKVALAHAYLMTPPDPRVGNLRHLPEYGDTFDLRTDPTAARARPTYWKDFALAVKDKQPREAAQILWMLGEKDGAAPLDGQSRQLAGFGSVFRHAFNTPDESYLAVHQDSFSFGHYHWDLGALYFFGLGAPLAVDWPSLYAPQINQAWRHNGVSVARQERFAYQGRVEKSALTPRADYSRSRVFYDTAFPPAKLSSAHAQREQAALPDLPGNKPGLASPDLKAKARENAQLNPLAAGPGSLLPLASDDVPEHCWQRQVVFVKGLNSQAYVVVRDAVTDTRPTEWNLWTLSDKLRLAPLRADVTGLYGVNLSVNFFIGPDTTPTTEMFGFGEPPAGTPAGEVKRATVAPGVTEITVPRRHLMQQNAVRLTSASGGAYGAVLFPYRPGTKPPAIYKGANETVTVTTDAGTDTIFLSPNARTATVGDITLQGRAAVVSRAGRNITLQLLEGDMLTIANGPGIRGVGPITLEASDNEMIVQLDGAAREIEIVLPAGMRGLWVGNIPGVMLLGREKDRMRLKVAAGKHDFRISVSARESQNSQ